MPDELALICPACRCVLERAVDELTCPHCGLRFPVIGGVPDLRQRSDRYLDLDADRDKARELASRSDLGFADLTAEYWRRTPEVPADLAARYLRNAIAAPRRAAAYLGAIGRPLTGRSLLDVGCGTGGLLEAAVRLGARPVGVDVALRWLVIARRRLDEGGFDVPLVAADGAVLPFRAATFDIATCIETLEHAEDQRGLLQSVLLVVRPGGNALLVTANRFSLAPEPTVGLWLVGYLPRRLAAGYVRRRRATNYEFFRAVSASELRAMVGPRRDLQVGPASPPPPPPEASGLRLRAHVAYERIVRFRTLLPLTTALGPFLKVAGEVSDTSW